MASDNLKRIGLKLAADHFSEDGRVLIAHDSSRKFTANLPHDLRHHVDSLFDEVRAAIPNDFSFSISFDSDGAEISVVFEDGDTGSSAGGGLFTSRKSMLRKLRGLPWDAMRGELIKQSEIYDEMLSAADDRPPDIPSSRDAAGKYSSELKLAMRSLADSKAQASEFSMIVASEGGQIEVNHFNDRDALIGEMVDVMVHQFEILMVLEKGAEWTFEAIEAAKREAVEGMGPISRAKAERRFF